MQRVTPRAAWSVHAAAFLDVRGEARFLDRHDDECALDSGVTARGFADAPGQHLEAGLAAFGGLAGVGREGRGRERVSCAGP